MSRARGLAVAGLIVFYGAVGARQPAVRVAVSLPVPASAIAASAGLPSSDTATLLLNLTRVLYQAPLGQSASADKRRRAVREVMFTRQEKPGEQVPLPLDPSIWRETILGIRGDDKYLVPAIVNDRRASLLYYGLSALDDATLAWLGPDRATLQHVRARPGVFAAFGRSIRVAGGRVVVPGGDEAGPLWASLVGEEPDKPGSFVRRVFQDGRLAYFYDTLAHLDPPRQRFALGMQLTAASRQERFRALFESFAAAAPEWRVDDHPFSRPQLDAALMLATLEVTAEGQLSGPSGRRVWERVFRSDEMLDVPFTEIPAGEIRGDDSGAIDAAWLAARVARVPYTLGRRRLDTFLFAQRVFRTDVSTEPAQVASALRGVEAFPALMGSLERIGVVEPAAYVEAARAAEAMNGIDPEPLRHTSMMAFQSVLGIVERARRSGGFSASAAQSLARRLSAVDAVDRRTYSARLARWIQTEFAGGFPAGAQRDSTDPVEAAVIAALAGGRGRAAAPEIEWEGRRYRVDLASAEARRIRRIRERQGGPSLDAALAGVSAASSNGNGESRGPDAERVLAETLASILYTVHLGDPDTQAVLAGNVALRHDFGFAPGKGKIHSSLPWRLPAEDFGSNSGWRLRGSLLGLEAALGRLALRRLDPTVMPPAPALSNNDLQTLMLTAALFNPVGLTDAARDEIAAALGRGRARVAALRPDPAELDRVAKDAGLGEWRRQTLAWVLAHDPASAAVHFSPLELFWLGAPRPSVLNALDDWGTAIHPLSGCLCLGMPAARAPEELSGRPTAGILATRYADVSLELAAALASLEVPAALLPGILGFAMQDVIDRARPAYPDDPLAFGRAAATLPRDRIIDYIAALTADGPLVAAGQ
jgi:hypothetical protein